MARSSPSPSRSGRRAGAAERGESAPSDAVPSAQVGANATPVLAPHDAAGLIAAAHANRRRARVIAALPGVAVFALVAIVLSGVGAPVIGLVAGVAAGVALSLSLLLGATSFLLRGLHARCAEEEELPRAYNLVDGLCASMGLSTPAIWIVEDDVRDALSIGRGPRRAVLVVTAGLLATLDPVALEAVLAHELTHIKRGDTAPATVSAAMLLPVAAFVPAVAGAVHRLAGRGREFRADRLAVGVTRYPPGLREALAQMSSGPRPRPSSPLAGRGAAQATRWLWTVTLPVAGARAGKEVAEAGGEVGEADSDDPRRGRGRGRAEGLVGELDAVPVRIAALDER